MRKSELGFVLSRLKAFHKPMLKFEQYQTDSEIASSLLWNAYMLKDISNKEIADLGAGTGILGIGALLLGAKKVDFVEIDSDAISIARNNIKEINNLGTINYNLKARANLINKPIEKYSKEVDVVIQNPPFGTKQRHADKAFLEKAFKISDTIYSIHKETIGFLTKIAEDFGFSITHLWEYSFPLKQAHSFHKSKIKRIKVIAVRFKRT
jgi:putative methylase